MKEEGDQDDQDLAVSCVDEEMKTLEESRMSPKMKRMPEEMDLEMTMGFLFLPDDSRGFREEMMEKRQQMRQTYWMAEEEVEGEKNASQP